MTAIATPPADHLPPPEFWAKEIHKGFNPLEPEILNGLELQLQRGEMVAIIGASGTGKTTLLNILGTLERPSSGQLLHRGEDVLAKNNQALAQFRNRTIGFVFQFHHLLREFSALENIVMPGLIAGVPKGELLEQGQSLLARMGLGHRAASKVGELSGGEQQRIALARALVMQPALLLADEPTGNLDPKTGYRVFDLLREMNADRHLATVMVTHNHTLAREMDHCLTLSEGKLHRS